MEAQVTRRLHIHEKVMLAGAFLLLLASVTASVVTSDRWVKLHSLEVQDARVMEDTQIIYKREFFREFAAQWLVSVYVMDRGQWEPYDSCGGTWDSYKPGVPSPYRTLSWLSGRDPDCYQFPKGTYYITLSLTVSPGSLLSRTAVIASNVFEVGGV
jgi:hypothetical protein